jgi:hypothetical protein
LLGGRIGQGRVEDLKLRIEEWEALVVVDDE